MIYSLVLTAGAFLFRSATGEADSPKPFQFPCYETDVCTWPLQYCSSFIHERRCIPCLASVCGLETPPHQCQYNCSLREQKRSGANISDVTMEKGKCLHNPTVIVSICGFIFLVTVICLTAVVLRKLKMKKKDDNIEGSEGLITSSEQPERDEKTGPRPSSSRGSYGERLKHVPPTRDSASPGPYQPTTHLDQRMSSS